VEERRLDGAGLSQGLKCGIVKLEWVANTNLKLFFMQIETKGRERQLAEKQQAVACQRVMRNFRQCS